MTQVVSMLACPVYHYAEVDRLLRLTPGTAKRWIDGYERAGRVYEPVVRQERTGSPWVTWGEFVETRLLSEFRSPVPMIKFRPVPSQQGVLLTPTSRCFTDATYYPDLDGPAEHIIADPATPAVWLHPLRRQGQPTVNNIRTETLTELVTAGEPMQFVADTYGLTLEEVEQAVTYQTTRRRAA
jgi:uncharacterized protein (DUF433 family)